MTNTDLQTNSWIMRHIPENLRAYALLGRFDRPIGAWLLGLPGAWAIFLGAQAFSFRMVWLLLLFAIGAVAMRAAGCVINDIWDRDIDKRVERTSVRPLAAEELSLWQAFKFLLILLGVGLLILVQTNAVTIMLGFLSVPFVIAYPIMKRFTWWPQAFLGLTFNFGVLMGWSAVAGSLAMPALLIYLGAIFWTIGYDTIYAYQDKEDDVMAGIKSTALKFDENGKPWVAGFYGIGFALMAWGFYSINMWGALFLLPAGLHMAWQVVRWDLSDTGSALAVFKSNRDCGLLVLAAAVGSFAFSVLI